MFPQGCSVLVGGRTGDRLCHMARGETLWRTMCPAGMGSCLEV